MTPFALNPLAVAVTVAVVVLLSGSDGKVPADRPVRSGAPPVGIDTGVDPDPVPFWGRVDCDEHPAPETSAHQVVPVGGDTHPMANGADQSDASFRRLTVYDGDDVAGERCELGFNDQNGPTAFYHEGERWITYASLRLPESTPIGEAWRVVLQMKQAEPYVNPVQASVFQLEIRGGRWWLGSNWKGVWDAPAAQDVWTRFVFDVVYSQDPAVGTIQVKADLNGDGDYSDDVDGDGTEDESSEVFHLATLVAETEGDERYTIPPKGSIPSHLRVGVYEDEAYPCPTSGPGCSIDVDNVQVVPG